MAKNTKSVSKTGITKRHSQEIAIRTRRRRVHGYLQNHHTVRDIAKLIDVSVETVMSDKKAIAKELAKEHEDIKAIDLDDLDTMERECIEQMAKWVKAADDILAVGDPDGGFKGLGEAARTASGWFDKRLRLKQLKGKWLGYEAVTKEQDVAVDNRSITINITDPVSNEEVSFDKWAEGRFKVLEGGSNDS